RAGARTRRARSTKSSGRSRRSEGSGTERSGFERSVPSERVASRQNRALGSTRTIRAHLLGSTSPKKRGARRAPLSPIARPDPSRTGWRAASARLLGFDIELDHDVVVDQVVGHTGVDDAEVLPVDL